MKDEYRLDNDMYFQWAQLIHAIPQTWKNKIKQNLMKNESNLLVLNHHLLKNARIQTLDNAIFLFGDTCPRDYLVFVYESETALIDSYQFEILLRIKRKREFKYVFRYKILPKMLSTFLICSFYNLKVWSVISRKFISSEKYIIKYNLYITCI